jgi:copper(I)-binding protein
VAELHQMTMGENDVMQMRPVEGGIPVPAGGTARLQPGGLHVMLIGLTQELAVDATLDLTLNFAESGVIELTVPVQEPPEEGMSMGGMSGG